MALLASCFRVLNRTADPPPDHRSQVAAAVGYSIRPVTRERDPFRSFGSEMILAAGRDELEDREALTRLLVKRMREQVRRGFDQHFAHRPHPRVIEHAHHLIMPWSPPGLAVSANACHGRLHVAVTSGVEAVSEKMADVFADGLIEDIA